MKLLKGSSSFADQPSRNKLSSPLLQVQPATVELLNSYSSQTASLPTAVADVRTYEAKWSIFMSKRSLVGSLFAHSLGFILLTITTYQLKLAWCRRHGVSQLVVIFQLPHRFRAPHAIGLVGSGVTPSIGLSSFADQPSKNKLNSPLLQVQPATVKLLNN